MFLTCFLCHMFAGFSYWVPGGQCLLTVFFGAEATFSHFPTRLVTPAPPRARVRAHSQMSVRRFVWIRCRSFPRDAHCPLSVSEGLTAQAPPRNDLALALGRGRKGRERLCPAPAPPPGPALPGAAPGGVRSELGAQLGCRCTGRSGQGAPPSLAGTVRPWGAEGQHPTLQPFLSPPPQRRARDPGSGTQPGLGVLITYGD